MYVHFTNEQTEGQRVNNIPKFPLNLLRFRAGIPTEAVWLESPHLNQPLFYLVLKSTHCIEAITYQLTSSGSLRAKCSLLYYKRWGLSEPHLDLIVCLAKVHSNKADASCRETGCRLESECSVMAVS